MNTPNLTRRLVEQALAITLSDVPASVKASATDLITDTLGVAIAGINTDVGRLVIQYAAEMGGAPQSHALGATTKVPAPMAAFVNGTLAHALDLDDDEPLIFIGHVSAPVFATVFAAAPRCEASGRDLLTAFITGVEAEFALGRILNPRHYNSGHHATSSIGVLGASLAASKMLGLSVDQALNAFGFAAAHMLGLKRNFGTMTKPMHVGRAAEAAITAALLSSRAATASTSILDGPAGLVDMYSDNSEEVVHDALDRLGLQFGLDEPGVAIKQYPSCSNTHPAIDAMLQLRKETDVADISSIECFVAPGTEKMLQYPRPANGLQAKFSMEYCLAVAAIHGAPWIEHFDDAALEDAVVESCSRLITMRPDPRLVTSALGVTTAATVRLTLTDGRTRELTVRSPRGSQGSPLARHEIYGKFRKCVSALSNEQSEALFAAASGIESAPLADELLTTAVSFTSNPAPLSLPEDSHDDPPH